jgi:hypothetical protein
MKNLKAARTKLTVDIQTVRRLTPEQLNAVHGGSIYYIPGLEPSATLLPASRATGGNFGSYLLG